MAPMDFDPKFCDDKEETATQTPRSTSNNSKYDSSVETPRSEPAKSEDMSPDEDEDDDNIQEDEYYAFLRDYAGSFEATGDDDEDDDEESEFGSEDGFGNEVEDKLQREKGPSCGDPEFELVPPLPAKWQGSEGGSSAEWEKVNGDVEGWSVAAAPGAPKLCPRLPALCPQAFADSNGFGSGFSGLVTDPLDSDGFELSGGRDKRSGPPSPTCVDSRGPVEDDYDVAQAVRAYAQQRSGDWLQQRREDLQEAIRQKQAQAESLLGPSENAKLATHLRVHYARVRRELIAEMHNLEAELARCVPQASKPMGGVQQRMCAKESMRYCSGPSPWLRMGLQRASAAAMFGRLGAQAPQVATVVSG